MSGLSDGLAAFASKPLEKITQMGAALRDQFKSILGIKSPSRVFGSLGFAIAEGASVGINAGRGLAVGAVAGLALASTAAWGNPKLASPLLSANKAGIAANLPALGANVGAIPDWVPLVKPLQAQLQAQDRPQAGPAMNITFAPNITVSAADPGAVRDQVGQAMQLSFAEFERMMQRYTREQARNNYGGRP
jgi:hypothetical protein